MSGIVSSNNYGFDFIFKPTKTKIWSLKNVELATSPMEPSPNLKGSLYHWLAPLHLWIGIGMHPHPVYEGKAKRGSTKQPAFVV